MYEVSPGSMLSRGVARIPPNIYDREPCNTSSWLLTLNCCCEAFYLRSLRWGGVLAEPLLSLLEVVRNFLVFYPKKYVTRFQNISLPKFENLCFEILKIGVIQKYEKQPLWFRVFLAGYFFYICIKVMKKILRFPKDPKY